MATGIVTQPRRDRHCQRRQHDRAAVGDADLVENHVRTRCRFFGDGDLGASEGAGDRHFSFPSLRASV
jgi:hypothetical protein